MLFILIFSIIKQAVFYPSNIALITEEREVKLKKGYNIIELRFLPAIDENSFRIEFKDGEIISTSVERKKYLKLKGKFKFLQDSLDFLNRKIDSLKIRKENLKKAKEFLESFKVSYPEKESKEFLIKKFEPENIKKAIDLITGEGTKIELETKSIDEITHELEWKRGKIEIKIRELSPIGKEELILKIHLNSRIEGITKLKIKYLLLNKTGFLITYKIKGEPEKKKLNIFQYAKVYQITGDDFENIELALSTYKLKKEIKPLPGKWSISALSREQVKTLKKSEPPSKFRVEAIRIPPRGTKETAVKPEKLYTSFHYEFPYKITLPSSEEGRLFYIKNYELPAEYEYEVFPRQGKIAFLKAKAYIETKEPLLEGDINIFLGEEFVGKDYNYGYNPGDSVTFYFGEDPFVKVEHKLIKSEVKKGSLFNSKKVKRKYGYKTVIKNNRENKIKGILVEQVPVSSNPDIQVKEIKFSKKPFKEDKVKGFYYFKFELNPGEEYNIEYYFEVISPKDMVIMGL